MICLIPLAAIEPLNKSDSNHSSISSGIIIGTVLMMSTKPRVPCVLSGFKILLRAMTSFIPSAEILGGVVL